MNAIAWDSTVEVLETGSVHKLRFGRDGSPASYSQVIEAWTDDSVFRSLFSSVLAKRPFAAFRWETPALTAASVSLPFECVVLDAPWLDTPPDPSPFAPHFETARGDCIVTFPNLGGDAQLIVPCPVADERVYVHLAVFLRDGPEEQKHELWATLGRELGQRADDRTLWVSTAGGGVDWIHVRLDSRPKYYGHLPYRAITPA